MSVNSLSPPTSPSATKPQHSCLECKRLKRACDKKLPCGKCARANRTCEYKDPSDDGLFSPISSARDIHSMTIGTLLEIHHNKQKVMDAVSLYFGGANTWFTIVERASFEAHLESTWDDLSAETSVVALCMALVAQPPNQKQSKGMSDATYTSVKSALSAVQSELPMSVPLLQAELLVAMYEFAHSMPQQAYLSLGRCFQMTRAFGWHNAAFWSSAQAAEPAVLRQLKLYSILWWAIVYVDCLLNIAYQNQSYPMHTADLAPFSVIPRPEAFDQHFLASVPLQFGAAAAAAPNQQAALQDPHGDVIDGIVFPEATSAWYLGLVLQQLSNPTLVPDLDSKALSEKIWQHARCTASARWRAGDRNAAVGTDLIALLKLNQPALFGGLGAMIPSCVVDNHHLDLTHDEAARGIIRTVIDVIHDKADGLAKSGDRLRRGAIDPCWAFAMCYAALLLVSHGDGALQDAAWLDKVCDLRAALDKVALRWKIAERYCESVKIALENRHSAYNLSA
ncbi:hypothetical protein N658DRAFT_427224 [Parathielavia hyrcaniae]|uniref:Zn(2)-C6 fungal-type domain-containing protein n=1 Tax=Parathielavia hyrcaniae TaxID=113614 RepID=A0AAN6T1K8_9PEZI|nr:hypothetical protein N658DRAFT_427224 [Parathielavia hyrcaniae]